MGWRGKVQLKCGDGRKLLVAVGRAPLSEGRAPFRRARPFQEGRDPFKKGAPPRTFQKGRALIAYLNGRGLKPLREVW